MPSSTLQGQPTAPDQFLPEVQCIWFTSTCPKCVSPTLARTHSWPCPVTSWNGNLKTPRSTCQIKSQTCPASSPQDLSSVPAALPFPCLARLVLASQFSNLNNVLLEIQTWYKKVEDLWKRLMKRLRQESGLVSCGGKEEDTTKGVHYHLLLCIILLLLHTTVKIHTRSS